METYIYKYAEVIVPLPLNTTFTYAVPESQLGKLRQGSRVVVQFGKRKFYTAIVVSLSNSLPENHVGELKEISELLDSEPIVQRPQLQLWEWMAEYYMCSVGDVYRAALPSGLKLESETFVELAPEYFDRQSEAALLPEKEQAVLAFLIKTDKRVSLADISKSVEAKNLPSLLTSLLDRQFVIVSEKLVERYRSVKETYVELCANRGAVGENSRLFSLVKGAAKQETALLALIELSRFQRPASEPMKEVRRKDLIERSGVSSAIISAMVKKGVIRTYEKIVGRFSYSGKASGSLPQLSESQSKALAEIHHSWFDHDVTLLHGVTSSGKTEIYIHLIDYVLKQKRQALFLVPEIALTTQLTMRLQKVFGDKVIIYHSKFSDNERVEIWRRMLSEKGPCVAIGARSAVFLPFSSLGLVIVDEEHESSYKQQDPAPRYNGRDLAIVLAKLHGAKTLLGSATPTVETYYKAKSGRFGLVTLTERFGGVSLPEIEIVDMNRARQRGAVNGAFSDRLRQLIDDGAERGEQSILFLNRRGYAPIAECRCCAHVPKCRDCDVTLTYHKRINRLVCHYCGQEYELPSRCPVCKEPAVEIHGYGTERLEEDLKDAFPHRRIMRMDLDTTRAKSGYDTIIDEFSKGKADILVGTQMVTKGLDFGGVSTVGVVMADSMINMPEFKAAERAFNMIGQVAGRAGRREKPGRVVIQTRQPANPLLKHIVNHDYLSFYTEELEERQKYSYPPFTRLINIFLRHRDPKAARDLAVAFGYRLRQLFGSRVHGPEEPEIARIQSLYIRKFMLKFEPNVSISKAKIILRQATEELKSSGLDGAKSAIITFDVDP